MQGEEREQAFQRDLVRRWRRDLARCKLLLLRVPEGGWWWYGTGSGRVQRVLALILWSHRRGRVQVRSCRSVLGHGLDAVPDAIVLVERTAMRGSHLLAGARWYVS